MNINESKEFEAINQKVNERKFLEETEYQCKEAFHNVKRTKAKRKALFRICITNGLFLVGVAGFFFLESIGWIDEIFNVVLTCIAGAVAMFKIGYFWHEIKN